MAYDIEALKRKMLVKYPFFGSVVSNVKYVEDKKIQTAGTDGKTIYYNPDFLQGLSVEEQTFIFAHEVCHIAFNHILRSEGKKPGIWNIATDAVINQFLIKDGLKMVEGGVDIEDAINYDAEQLYEKLLKEKQDNDNQNKKEGKQGQQGNSSQSQSGSSQSQNQSQGTSQSQEEQEENSQAQGSEQNQGQGNDSQEKKDGDSNSNGENENESEEKEKDAGHDTHSMWEDAVKEHKEEQEKQKDKKSVLDKILGKDRKDEVQKKQEELEKMGEKSAFKKNVEDRKKQLEELKDSLNKQMSRAGTTTNEEIRKVNNIGKAKPIIDWRYILREALKYEADWSYKNATIENGVVVPHLEVQPIPEAEILLDTSGSISEVLLRNFLRECKNMLKQTKLKVGCFDTKFYGFHDIRTPEDIEKMKYQGGGGTNFDVAVNAFTKRVENKIIFTDGEASMPEKPLDVIWIVFGNRKINPKGGRVIYITPEQLAKLYSFEIENETRGRSR